MLSFPRKRESRSFLGRLDARLHGHDGQARESACLLRHRNNESKYLDLLRVKFPCGFHSCERLYFPSLPET